MIPPQEKNIYPKSDENIIALTSFYFDEFDINQEGILDMVKKKTSLKLNQIEFIFAKISQGIIPIFKKHLKGELKLTNLLQYALDALKEDEVTGTAGRILIIKELKDFMYQTKSIYL